MPERVTPADPGLLASVADQISLPGYGVRNLLRGDMEAAGRNVADFILNIPDAILPGDLIPEISGEGDRPDFEDVAGTSDGTFLGDAVNFLGNVATDPITYIPGAALAKGAGAVTKGVSAVTPKAVKDVVVPAAAKAGKVLRRTFGAEKIGKPLKDVITRAQGAKETAARASQEPIVEGLKGATARELEAATEVLTNVTRDKATKAARVLDETETMNAQQRLAQYLLTNPDVDPERMLRIVNTATGVGKGQAASGTAGNIFTDVGKLEEEYFPRLMKKDEPDDLVNEMLGQPSPIAERKLKTAKDLANYLTKNTDVELANAAEALGKRAGAQGELAARGATGQGLFEMARAGEVGFSDDLLARAASRMQKPPIQEAPVAPRKTAALDASGKPRVLLHGTDNPDVVFDKDIPTFFTTADDKVFASGRSPIRPHVVEANVFVENPLTPEIAKSRLGEIVKAFEKFGVPEGNKKEILRGIATGNPEAWYYVPEQAKKAYQSLGYDGINVNSGLAEGGEWWIPFSGKQVQRLGGPSAKALPESAAASKSAATGLNDVQRKEAREWLLSQKYKQADPLMRETAEAIANNLVGDERDVALTMLKGMEKRGAVTGALSKLNRYFKPYAVYGAVIPKLGSITRNLTGGLWQQFSNAEARGTVGQAALRLVPTWLKSIEDGVERLIGKRLFTKNEFTEVDAAFKASGGDPRKALDLITDKDMRAAVERGVLGNNFVDTEQLIKSTSRGGWKALGGNLLDYPGDMFKGAEQRMRYGLFKDLLKQKKSADDAARIVRESFYDYTISSAENRLARDTIPFLQFMGKAVPQQAKLFAEKPWLASGVANLYAQGRDEPVTPMMEGKVNIPIGTDEQGNRQYISNLGLPFEALSVLPNLSASPLQAGRDIEQGVVGSSQPLLKALYSYVSGRDPTFGSMPGSYSRVAGQDLGEGGAILNQLLNSGVPYASAIAAPLGVAGKLTDERTNLGETALGLLTGARISTVDPDKAIQDRLQAFLERDPSVGQFRRFYSRGEDDVTAESLLENLKQAQKALKEKRKAMANVN